MPNFTSTLVAHSCIGIEPIEVLIDKRKLLLFGQLCNAHCHFKFKTMFVNRLAMFMNNPRNCTGFMPDIYRILGKYNLLYVLRNFLEKADFKSIESWKRTVKLSIKRYVDHEFKVNLEANASLFQFETIQSEFMPCSLWHFSRIYREQLDNCLTAVNVICRLFSRKLNYTCPNCSLSVEDIAMHIVMFCTENEKIRNNMWTSLHSCLGSDEFYKLISLSPFAQLLQLVSGFTLLRIDDVARVKCAKLSLQFIHRQAYKLRYIMC